MRAILVVLIAMSCVACSKADVNKTSSDLKAAGSEIKDAPAVKALGTDIKVAAKHTGEQLKVGAERAKVELSKAGDKAKEAGDRAKEKAHEATSEDKG